MNNEITKVKDTILLPNGYREKGEKLDWLSRIKRNTKRYIDIIAMENKTQIKSNVSSIRKITYWIKNIFPPFMHTFRIIVPLFSMFNILFFDDLPTGLSSAIGYFLFPSNVTMLFLTPFILNMGIYNTVSSTRRERITSQTCIYLFIFCSFVIISCVINSIREIHDINTKLRYNTLQKSSSGLLDTYFTLEMGMRKSLFLRGIAYSLNYFIMQLSTVLFLSIVGFFVIGGGNIVLLPLKVLLVIIYCAIDLFFSVNSAVQETLEDLSYSSRKTPKSINVNYITNSLSAVRTTIAIFNFWNHSFLVAGQKDLNPYLCLFNNVIASHSDNITNKQVITFQDTIKDLYKGGILGAFLTMLGKNKPNVLALEEGIKRIIESGFTDFDAAKKTMSMIAAYKNSFEMTGMVKSVEMFQKILNSVPEMDLNGILDKCGVIVANNKKDIFIKFRQIFSSNKTTIWGGLKETFAAIHSSNTNEIKRSYIASELTNCSKDWIGTMTRMLLAKDLSFMPIHFRVGNENNMTHLWRTNYIFFAFPLVAEPSYFFYNMMNSTIATMIMANTIGALLAGYFAAFIYAITIVITIPVSNLYFDLVTHRFWLYGLQNY